MNFEQVLIGNLVNSIKKEYTPSDSPDFFKLSSYDIEESLSLFLKFIQLNDENDGELDRSNLESLISYISNSSLFETYINDLIAPNVNETQKSSLDLFKDGIRQINNVGDLEEETMGMIHQMTMMLMPVPLASSLIMSSYLTLLDYQSGEYGSLDDFLKRLSIHEGQYLDLYHSIIRLLINPLCQILQYRMLHLDKNIPVLFVMSLGSLSAMTYDEEKESLLSQIEEGIKMTMDKIQNALDDSSDPIN